MPGAYLLWDDLFVLQPAKYTYEDAVAALNVNLGPRHHVAWVKDVGQSDDEESPKPAPRRTTGGFLSALQEVRYLLVDARGYASFQPVREKRLQRRPGRCFL